MFIPYSDDNPRKKFPFITYLLIIANVGVFAYYFTRPGYEEIVYEYGFIPQRYDVLTIFTSMFLHGDWFHLIFNMWFLALFGDNVEFRLGRLRYLSFYVIGGVIASLTHAFLTAPAGLAMPTVGASGAVSAVMGAYMVLFPKAKVKCVFFLWIIPLFFQLSAYIFLAFWLALQTLYIGQESNVAFWAHIGGFVYGFAAGIFVRLFLKQNA